MCLDAGAYDSVSRAHVGRQARRCRGALPSGVGVIRASHSHTADEIDPFTRAVFETDRQKDVRDSRYHSSLEIGRRPPRKLVERPPRNGIRSKVVATPVRERRSPCNRRRHALPARVSEAQVPRPRRWSVRAGRCSLRSVAHRAPSARAGNCRAAPPRQRARVRRRVPSRRHGRRLPRTPSDRGEHVVERFEHG